MTSPSRPRVDPSTPPLKPPTPYRTGALVSLLRRHWFIHLRWVFVVVAGGLLAVERVAHPQLPRPGALYATVVAIALVNVVWTVIARSRWSRAQAETVDDTGSIRGALAFANAQVAVDLLLLTVIMRYTGGVENPMAVFYLFHMAIGSLVLRSWQAALQGVWAVGLFAAMGIAELRGWVQPHYLLLPALPAPGLYAQPDYVAVVIAVFAGGVFGTMFFTLRTASRLDEGEHRLREAHEALQASQLAIFDLQARRSRFMATAAHQLKSPLAGIQTLAGLIRDGVVQGAKLAPTCEKIIRRCREGVAQVTELLTLARMQGADSRRQRGQVTDVGEAVGQVCQRFLPDAAGKQITLERHVPENVDLRAAVHSADLSDCVGNLVDNAIKYTPGPGKVTIKVGRGAPDERLTGLVPVSQRRHLGAAFVYVTVKDTGLGIEPDMLTPTDEPGGAGSIFDAFRRGNGALAAGIPGTGLGLSIVREVVEQAGGRIYALSHPGEGTTFTVMLPAAAAASEGPVVRDTRSSRIVIESATPDGDADRAAASEETRHAG